MMNIAGESLYLGRNKKSVLGTVTNVIIVLLIILLTAEIFFNANYTGIYVVNRSMTPTFTGANSITSPGGDYIYIKNGAIPTYGDVVVLFREEENDNIIKRAIAFGGDTLKIEGGVLYLKKSGEEDFSEINESYLVAEYNDPARNNYDEYTVPEGGVFLIGDNRNESYDSRSHGAYPIKDVLGVVPQWSINIKDFTSAWHRFFRFTLRGIKT